MSQQEAASIGPFDPISSQQQASMAAEQEQRTPFVRASESQGPAMPDYQAEEAAAESRSRRRRAWTIVALALIIPAGAAAALALILTGGDSGPTDTVTRVPQAVETTTTAQTATAATTTSPAVTSTPTGTTTTQQSTVAAQPAAASSETAQASPAATEAAETTAATAEATASLSPEARLAAWTEIERIEVVTGETLWLLAQQYDTTISAIALLNGITDPESLSVGQLLSIPVGFTEEVSLTGETIESAAAVSESPDSSSAGSDAIITAVTLTPATGTPDDLANWANTVQMVIVAGDSLDAIANANGTSVEAIQLLNGIADPNLIFEGQEILVPVGYEGSFSLATPAVDTNVSSSEVTVATEDGASTASETVATPTDDDDDLLLSEDDPGAGAGDEDDWNMQE